ncbi:class I SAM-dependent RNA methyltransferase [Roseicyclus sp. F158]|uniref:Class I SAM-dependent RNA methyltransferase n=1 Tax=Tropicimonas omnivorans TaxID=3075590 RepID=A0ABU3DBF7_9RHOB|nr:class I SAM-dependent RNA methyltransferase [Roseicyclus sp. F158]MDT0681051.1 class I SAM-dependent RNA methyltransferase [Roseicyclus sp. F158]
MTDTLDIFLVVAPGLETVLAEEARASGFDVAEVTPGGVSLRGGWPEVWRANLELRGASRVLVRVASFMAFHLAQLDKRARKIAWGEVLRADVPVRVEATSSKASKIYHGGAAAQRIGRAINEELGAPLTDDAALTLKARIDDNRVTISVDTSGPTLHKRGHKEAVGKAPMRETLAALFLRRCGFTGTEPLVDPMCGSGTFIIEGAEMAAGLQPGRSRGFAFEHLANFDPAAWTSLKGRAGGSAPCRHHGFDRDPGAIRMATANAERAGVGQGTSFAPGSISELQRPEGPSGLVIVNPPYGGRIGNKQGLHALYGSLGKVLAERFSGWRVGIVTSEAGLARATGLPLLKADAPVPHGGLKVALHRTDPLP